MTTPRFKESPEFSRGNNSISWPGCIIAVSQSQIPLEEEKSEKKERTKQEKKRLNRTGSDRDKKLGIWRQIESWI